MSLKNPYNPTTEKEKYCAWMAGVNNAILWLREQSTIIGNKTEENASLISGNIGLMSRKLEKELTDDYVNYLKESE